MSSLFGLAEQVFSNANSESHSQSQLHKTGGHEFNSPHHRQQHEGGFNTQEVLAHADDVDDEGKGYIAKAISHVHSNPEEHSREVSGGDMAKYAPMIISALSSVSSKSGVDISKLMSSGGGSGGNQVMGMLMKEVSKNFMGGGEEKQSAMNGAAMTLAKLVAQKQLSAFIGGSNSGGLGMLEMGKTLLSSRFG